MLRHVPLLVLVLPGCLVSFNDYPVGDIHATEPTAGTAPSSSGASVGGSGNATSGTDSGGTTQPTAGTETGGTETVPMAGESGVPPEMGAAGAPPVVDSRNLIDDFEDEDEAILEVMGRSGAWYVGNDGRGTQTPKAGSPLLPAALAVANPMDPGSTRGAHTAGGPFYDWGALIGTALAVAEDNAVPYDLSPYTGVKLWVRSGSNFSGGGGWGGATVAREVRINFPTVATGSGFGCITCDNDHFGTEIPLTSKWVQIDVPFSSLKQGGFGKPALRDLHQVLGVELLFPKSVTFDLWVDDIELY